MENHHGTVEVTLVLRNKYNDENEILEDFEAIMGTFSGKRTFDLLPHMAISHGFIEYYMLIHKKFPSLAPRGVEDTEKMFNHFCDLLFEKTYYLNITFKQKRFLREQGWKEYLSD